MKGNVFLNCNNKKSVKEKNITLLQTTGWHKIQKLIAKKEKTVSENKNKNDKKKYKVNCKDRFKRKKQQKRQNRKGM